MSEGVRGLVLQKLGRIWGMTSIGDDIKEKLESLHTIANATKDKCENLEELRAKDRSVNKAFLCRCSDEQSPDISTIHSERTRLKVDELEATQSTITSSSAPSGSQANIDHRKQRSGNGNVTTEKQAQGVEGPSTLLDDSINSGVNVTMKISRERLNIQNFQNEPSHYCKCESCLGKPEKTRCFSFINEMIVLNQRLVSDIQEINFLARNWEYKSSQKEHWLIAATILDRGFLILFVVIFAILTLCNFIR